MLFKSLIALLIALFGMTTALAASVDKLDASYDYLPPVARPLATHEENQQSTNAYRQSLTPAQSQGIAMGEKWIDKLQENIRINPSMRLEAENLKAQQETIVRQAYKGMATTMTASAKTASRQLALYYFISFSMPDALIQSYLQDASQNGGVLVLRGVTQGSTLAQFIKQKLLPLLRYRGAHAKVIIDPNRFERYGIDKVPTITIAWEDSDQQGCDIESLSNHPATVTHCRVAKPQDYWKLSGNVTSRFALERLQIAGAPVAPFLEQTERSHQALDVRQSPFSSVF